MNLLVDFIAISIQCYLLSRTVCNLLPVHEPKERSFWLAFMQMWAGHIVSTFIFNASPIQKIISGSLAYIIGGLFIYNGRLFLKIVLGAFQYLILLVLDFVIQFVMFEEYIVVVKTLPLFEASMVARLLGTPMVFLLCLGADFWVSKHKGILIKMIGGLGLAMGLLQWLILDTLFTVNAGGIIRNHVGMSFIFSSVLMGGYIVVIELFRVKIKQQEKESELEQIRLETQYQYELYRQALEQGEALRNLRHDMRNQLQTIQCLIAAKDEHDKEQAVQMLNEIKRKMN